MKNTERETSTLWAICSAPSQAVELYPDSAQIKFTFCFVFVLSLIEDLNL